MEERARMPVSEPSHPRCFLQDTDTSAQVHAHGYFHSENGVLRYEASSRDALGDLILVGVV